MADENKEKKQGRGRRGRGGKQNSSGNKKKQHDNSTGADTGPNTSAGQPTPGSGNENAKKNNRNQRINKYKIQNPELPDEDRTRRHDSAKSNNNSSKKNRGRNSNMRKSNDSDENDGSNSSSAYPPHWTLDRCLSLYNSKDPQLVRGILRVIPGKDCMSFCTCDRGMQKKDVLLEAPKHRNRALDGDLVYVHLSDEPQNSENERNDSSEQNSSGKRAEAEEGGDEVEDPVLWQDDPIQMNLWAPLVRIRRHAGIQRTSPPSDGEATRNEQRRGRVVHVVPPKTWQSEIQPNKPAPAACRSIVGTLKRLNRGVTLLTPSNRSLPQFKCSVAASAKFQNSPDDAIFEAKYIYGSWQEGHNWPPCANLKQMGTACNVEDETKALLMMNGVDHGEFPPTVLDNCQQVVASGEYTNGTESGWKPTPEMYEGRRDYRSRRIFTIDPTTAKDLDDALHIEDLGNGQVEIGVHIADVSFFVQPDSSIDREAQRRCTTVYLVDRTIPMLPRPLCEIACSLNENVERLAFSCVWRMNLDGTVADPHNIWYGRTVIKSCARLDYATAQNIIDDKVATGEAEPDEGLWPKARQPTGGHTIDQVAADVRLMNKVAQVRRQLRFQHGAIALSKVKLTFQLDGDGETPLLCQPYAIRDSNRLVEEYMLLANYLVAQRLITHAGGLALLRHHEPPPFDGLEEVAAVAKLAIGFKIDTSSSAGLQRSLNRLARECDDELTIQCVTEMLKTPLKPANYIAAGDMSEDRWAHFALNIPYYTHFTSPIRRYADVMVHRLLQASLDGPEHVAQFPFDTRDIGNICGNCNDKKDASRKAQERSDEVFLALYLRKKPIRSELGVVLSVGEKTFTVFVPSLGMSAKLFLDEHNDWIKYSAQEGNGDKRIKLERTTGHNGERWTEILIKFFTKIRVTCVCKDKPPIAVKLLLEGPWTES